MFFKKALNVLTTTLIIGLLSVALPLWGDEKKPSAEERAAVVNGTPISMDEYNGEVIRIQKTILGIGKPLNCAQIASIQKEVVESLVRREILFQESRKAGVRIDEKAIDSEIDTLKKQFLSDAEYKNELSRRRLSEEALRTFLERGLSIQRYVEQQFLEKATVTDADMIAYYESHVSLLKQPLQVRVSHILIQSDSKWEASRQEGARRKAEQILKDLQNGQAFEKLAREHSDGPTRTKGGDLGFIRMGQLEKRLEDVVFNLKTGETSGIVETDYGFHVFKTVDRKAESIVAYDSVKEKIRQHLLQEKAKQEAELHARKLREKAVVEIFVSEDGSPVKRP